MAVIPAGLQPSVPLVLQHLPLLRPPLLPVVEWQPQWRHCAKFRQTISFIYATGQREIDDKGARGI
ncbi:MAG: hypothetical protein IPL01_24790 [Acidobacteria bacterium]|nr:hypothetical protein [Acidobacteriota bacterium]